LHHDLFALDEAGLDRNRAAEVVGYFDLACLRERAAAAPFSYKQNPAHQTGSKI
jgi:hypothetical protein